MSRYARRTDDNHEDIVKALRAVGAFVWSLAALGRGTPDLLVGLRRKWWLLEVKDGAKAPSDRRLSKAEAEFFSIAEAMELPVAVVTSPEDALRAVGVMR